VRLDEELAVFGGDEDEDDVDGPNRRGGVGEGCFALGEFEPEVVHVFGAGLDAPGGEGFGGKAGLEPVGEGLRGREVVAARGEGVKGGGCVRVFGGCCGEGHGGEFEEAARKGAAGGGDVGLGGGDEEADGEGCE